MIKRKVRKLAPFIVAAVFVAGGFFYLKSKSGVTRVTVSKAEFRSISKTISSSGETAVREGLTVRALVAGSVKKVNFKSGAQVNKGDVVVEMDQVSLKASLDSAYSTYLSAKAAVDSYDQQVTAAKATELIRKRERDEAWREYMADNDEDNKQAYKNAEALYQTALSSLKILEDDKKATQNTAYSTYSTYHSALNNYQNSVLKAPADGKLALADISEGSYVVAGQKIFSITNSKDLTFKAEIDEADVSNIKPGMPARLSLDSYPGKTFGGTVDNVDAKVVILPSGSAVIMADISFDTKDILPIVGLSGSADIEVDKSESILSVTPEVLVEESNKNFVYVMDGDKAVKKEVEVGFEGDEYAGIVSGVNEGDFVIVDPGTLKITDGQKVKL